MLLRPLAAMKGWRGTLGADTAFGFAAVPMNDGTEPASGPSGIGVAGIAAAALEHAASAVAARTDTPVTTRRRVFEASMAISARTALPRPGSRSRWRPRKI